ncbi:MAG: guanylate kinase [bacterium]|nr:guanylate kinase [bacterium]MDY4100054.1 guanylate kinase [Lachnospiraceae bacterium]
MSYIFCLMGKSSSGKDTVYQRLLAEKELQLDRLVTGTTRPIREGERDGEEYYFYTDEQFQKLRADGKIIECRSYDTIHGIWNYFTVAYEKLDVAHHDYLTINTLEAYVKLRDHFGKDRLVPVYLEVDDGLRLQRALDRERVQQKPRYKELCRRFLADEEDFSPENLSRANIQPIFENVVLDDTVAKVAAYIKSIQNR